MQRALLHVLRPIWHLGNNRLSQVGVALATAGGITLVSLFTTGFFGVQLGPYFGIIGFFLLPAVLVLGLLLIAAGILRKFHRDKTSGRLPDEYPRIDLRDSQIRETLFFVAVMTGANLALLLSATYRGIHDMGSAQFCGQSCHVMDPQYAAYRNSPHARVECVQCHVGPGAAGFFQAKLSGTHQLFAMAFKSYPRPIPPPIEKLYPAKDTCGHCHSPNGFPDDKLIVRRGFADDEANSKTSTVFLAHLGGLDPQTGRARGIHGVHLEPGTEIAYGAADRGLQEIPYVSYRRPNVEAIEYVTAGGKSAAEWRNSGRLRRMDCIDCHNRPAHTFQTPGAGIDEAFAAGLLDPSLPFLKKQSLTILQTSYSSQADAAAQIPARLRDFYRQGQPEIFAKRQAAVDQAGATLTAVYSRNVFPEMKVSWGTYPNNLGHEAFPGCFRCHDGAHPSAQGQTITNDCNTCHKLVAVEERNPDVLKSLGLEQLGSAPPQKH